MVFELGMFCSLSTRLHRCISYMHCICSIEGGGDLFCKVKFQDKATVQLIGVLIFDFHAAEWPAGWCGWTLLTGFEQERRKAQLDL